MFDVKCVIFIVFFSRALSNHQSSNRDIRFETKSDITFSRQKDDVPVRWRRVGSQIRCDEIRFADHSKLPKAKDEQYRVSQCIA